MTKYIKRLPDSLRFGGSPLHHQKNTGEAPKADGIRRINKNCVELETFSNLQKVGGAHFVGTSIILSIFSALSIILMIDHLTPHLVIDTKKLLTIILLPWLLFIFAVSNFLLSGNHKSRGAYVRIHRKSRKIFFIPSGQKHVHSLDWNSVEALAGYIPIFTGSMFTSRHPLYLIGVDYNMKTPTEICIACGNLGVFEGDRSAKALWAFLQQFMAHGPEGLPEPPPLPNPLTRRQATLRSFHEWKNSLQLSLTTTRGLICAPFFVPARLFWLIWEVFPECLAEFIQYNIPYTDFPADIDELCGFAPKTNRL